MASPVLEKGHNFSRCLAALGGKRVQRAASKKCPHGRGLKAPRAPRRLYDSLSGGRGGVTTSGLRKGHNFSKGTIFRGVSRRPGGDACRGLP